MCFGLFEDSGCDFKRSELLYSFIQNLAGVFRIEDEQNLPVRTYGGLTRKSGSSFNKFCLFVNEKAVVCKA